MELPKPVSVNRFPCHPPNETSQLNQRSRDALQGLYAAHCYSQHNHGNVWDFAEEIGSLLQRGMMNSDLRWLVCIGLLKHGREITKVGDKRRNFLNDEGLYFSPTTCFVLTEKGTAYVRDFLIASPQANPAHNELDGHESTHETPVDGGSALPGTAELAPNWNRDLQELRVGSVIVKQFKVPAPNQEMVLAVFEEEEWPVSIIDPLPPHPEIDAKRRLRDTINSLNRNQKNQILHFRGNGSGDGVLWELLPTSTSLG